MKITKTKRILCLFLALDLFLVSVLPVTLAEENAVIEAPIIDEYLLDEAAACEVEANAEADNEEPIEQPEETMESEAEPFVESEEVLVIADEPSEQVDSAEPVLSIAEAVDEYGFCYGKITMATDVYSSPGRTDENRSYTLTSSSSIVLVRSIGEIRHGKQTVKQLIGQDQGVSTIELNDPDIKRFERIARKYGVDYAIKKVNGKDDYYQIFFKARDADALTSALTEFANQKHVRSKKPSVLQLMKSLKAKLMTMDKKATKDKTKEHSL